MNLQMYKQKQVAAKKGYDLLKQKSDALKVLFALYALLFTTRVIFLHASRFTIFRSDSEIFANRFMRPKHPWETCLRPCFLA